MNPDGVQRPNLIQDFRGEQRTTAENLLSPNVSPEALNIDYRDGTVRKRRGLLRMGIGALKGGLWVSQFYTGNPEGRRYAQSGNITLSGTLHTYNFRLGVDYEVVSGDVRIFVHASSGGVGTGLWLKNNAGSYRLEARCEHSGGTLAVMSSSSTLSGTIVVQYDTGTKTLTLKVNSTTNTGTLGGGDTYTQPASRIILGGAATDNKDKRFYFREFRVWDGAVGAYLANSSDLYTLTAAEQTSALRAWWRFADVNSTGFVDASGNGFTLQPLPQAAGPGCVDGGAFGDDLYWDDVEAMLCYIPASGGSIRYYVATRRAVYSWNGSISLDGTRRALGTDEILGVRDFRTQLLLHRDRVVAMNGAGENLADGVQLSYAAPAMSSGITITAAGSGGSLSAGLYKYLFAVYSSVTGVESAVGTQISSQTAVSNDEFTLDFTSGGFMGGRYFPGADKIRIYRTKAAGAVYYHLADIDIYSTSHIDDAADSTLVTLRPEYVGYAAPSRFGFVLNGALWLGNQAGTENRLVYTEPGTLGAFYSDNYIDLGEGEGLTGGVALGDRAVVFKRRSAWLVSGASGSVTAQILFPGVGCVQHATIAASHDRLFWLGEGGVYTMGLPLGGGAPESLTLDGWREFFVGMDDADYEACSGFWDPIDERYFLGFSNGGVRRTLVWHHRRQAWALWDLPLSGFMMDLDTPVIYVGVGNQVAQLDYGLSDGHYTNDLFDQPMYGTATGGSTTTLENSGAQWMVDGAGVLVGTPVRVTYPDGTTATRTVMGNTDKVLTVDAPWPAVTAGCTYEFGPINAYWRTPRMAPQGWDAKARIDRVLLLSQRIDYDDVAAVDSVSARLTLGEPASGAAYGRTQDFDWPVGQRLTRLPVQSGNCYEFQVRVSDDSARRAFDLAGIGIRLVSMEGSP